MNKSLKIILLLCLSISTISGAYAQKRKKRNKDKERYTENLNKQIPVYEMPTFNLDSLVDTAGIANSVEVMPNDNKGADSLCNVVIRYNEPKTKISGYRIQFWTGTNQNTMQQSVRNFKVHFSDLELSVHTEYPDGTFRVKAGDWVKADHLIAYRHLVKIREEFPQALLVPDMVDLDKI